MEKNNKTKIVAVISSLILLLLVIGASFAYFGSFETNLNNNVAVNIITASPGNATFISNATFLDLNVSASKMDLMNSDDNTPALTNEANLIISLTSGSDSLKTTCTYDIIYEYDYNSKVYGTGEEVVTSGATKEITLEVKGNGGTNNYSEEKNFNYDSLWTAKDDTNKKGPKKVLVSSVTIENSSANTPTVQNFTFTGRYYNLSLNQKQLINKSFTGKIYAESKGCVTKEDTRAFKTILAKNGGEGSIIKLPDSAFTSVTTASDKGLYKAEDDLGTSYYFRGAVNNNWVKFGKYLQDVIAYKGYYSTTSSHYEIYDTLEKCNSASMYNVNCTKVTYGLSGDDMYWRIIRINGDGSIRMIYTGTTDPKKDTSVTGSNGVYMTGDGTQIGESAFNTNYEKTEHVGYQYIEGQQHGYGECNESSASCTVNGNTVYNSKIKQAIDNWYVGTTLKDNPLISQDQIFCNDRTVSTSEVNYSTTNYTTLTIWNSTEEYYYGAYGRVQKSKSPILTCPTESDKFTSKKSSLGNKALTYPVGLITADEVAMAGGVFYPEDNNTYYLYTNQVYYLGSSSMYNSNYNCAIEFTVYSSGALYGSSVNGLSGIRPVISLSSEVKFSGDGTYNNPYIVN